MAIYWYEERWDFYSRGPDPWQKIFAAVGKVLLFAIGASIVCAALFGDGKGNAPRDTVPPAQSAPAKQGKD